jgi:protein translocase SecG subunit
MLEAIFSWSALYYLMLVLYIPACAGLIVVVMLQKGKGTGFAGAFGMGGGTDTVFGPRTSRSLPQRLTYGAAAIFLSLAMLMSIIYGRVVQGSAPGLVDEMSATTESNALEQFVDTGAAPAAPAATTESAAPATTTTIEIPAGQIATEAPPAAEAPATDAAAPAPAPAETTPAETTPAPADPAPAAEAPSGEQAAQ